MVVEMQSLGDALWAVALSAGTMIALAISIVAVAAAMQRRARGARIRASEQHPLRAAEELTLTPGRWSLRLVSSRRRSRRSDDCLHRGIASAWKAGFPGPDCPAPCLPGGLRVASVTGSHARLSACRRDQDSGCSGPRWRLARSLAEVAYGITFLSAGSALRLRLTGHPEAPRHSATRSPRPLACWRRRYILPGRALFRRPFRCLTVPQAWVPPRLSPRRIHSRMRTGCTWCSGPGRSVACSRPSSRDEA